MREESRRGALSVCVQCGMGRIEVLHGSGDAWVSVAWAPPCIQASHHACTLANLQISLKFCALLSGHVTTGPEAVAGGGALSSDSEAEGGATVSPVGSPAGHPLSQVSPRPKQRSRWGEREGITVLGPAIHCPDESTLMRVLGLSLVPFHMRNL